MSIGRMVRLSTRLELEAEDCFVSMGYLIGSRTATALSMVIGKTAMRSVYVVRYARYTLILQCNSEENPTTIPVSVWVSEYLILRYCKVIKKVKVGSG